ncbi:MAG: cytidylate kinase-like family protein [Blautia sp.]|nr:cytidylate kinase-like family protein [Blautia sp.]
MNHYVITIARQYGSGGRTIGENLARKLGIAYYDKNIIKLASDDSGINPQLFGRVDEYTSAPRPLFGAKSGTYSKEVLPPESRLFTSDENLFNYQAKAIRELAETEDCVIIGRCANLILNSADYPNVLRVYIHASWDFRMKDAAEKMSGTPKELEKFMKNDDRRKYDLCQRFIGKEWDDPAYYDLYLDTSKLGKQAVQDEIERRYLKLRKKGTGVPDGSV